jgi:C1A family cysteine protease
MPASPSLGWIPDLPDFRDYSLSNFKVAAPAENDAKSASSDTSSNFEFELKVSGKSALPSKVDLREYCSPVETQGKIGSCTAHAGVSLVEYYEKRNFGSYIPASRMFLYKVTRNLMKMSGDTGANPRNTMAALVLFGSPPEDHWAYNEADFDVEPPAFCYSFAQNYKTIKFYRHDLPRPNLSRKDTLDSLKTSLANGIPFMFGFTVYNSINNAAQNGRVPFPSPRDRRMGGHAISAFGYDDKMTIKHPSFPSLPASKGAILFQNSWGEQWGEKGYGWLPYDYVINGLAVDFWSIIKKDWVNTDEFSDIKVK